MSMNKIHRERGFTLIETLVAVTIVALAVSGPLFAADRSLIANEVSKEKFAASLLAQEGIEYMRFIRDNNYLAAYKAGGTNVSTVAWQQFTSAISACVAPNLCTLDPTQNAFVAAGQPGSVLQQCASGSCGPLYLNSYDIYTQTAGGNTKTLYTRSISFKTISAHEDAVTSTVSWEYHGNPYNVTVTDNLTAWQ